VDSPGSLDPFGIRRDQLAGKSRIVLKDAQIDADAGSEAQVVNVCGKIGTNFPLRWAA
jgi:hypothetical protein